MGLRSLVAGRDQSTRTRLSVPAELIFTGVHLSPPEAESDEVERHCLNLAIEIH